MSTSRRGERFETVKTVTHVFVADENVSARNSGTGGWARFHWSEIAIGDSGRLPLSGADKAIAKRRHDHEIDEGEHAGDDEEERHAQPRADGSELSHGSRRR